MYNCGPTVYGYAHIGNFRSYVFADILRRYFEYKGYKVKQVMNITDVGHLTQDDIDAGEDKIQEAAKKEKLSPYDLARFYEKAFVKDRERLNLKPLFAMPRATMHIKEMQEMVKGLLKKGHAYEVGGSVYYDILSFKNYGKLSGNTVDALEEGASGRAVEMNKEKRHFYDFSLWVNDPKHIMNWPSPWCKKGYPGWHLECSVMGIKYLGSQFDIHTGGEDNIFPHHEAEIAQTEGYTGKKWVSYWMHVRHLMVDNGKMSKSSGTLYTPQDIYDRSYSPQTLRWVLLSVHYRQKLNFTFRSLDVASKVLLRISNFMDSLDKVSGKSNSRVAKLIAKAKKEFEAGMDDDLNISVGIATVIGFVNAINKLIAKNALSISDAKNVKKQMLNFDKVFGVLDMKERSLTKELKDLIKKRDIARREKDWKTADEIRLTLKSRGILLDDTSKKTKWRRA